jgi:hypothetical protein
MSEAAVPTLMTAAAKAAGPKAAIPILMDAALKAAVLILMA